jgi:hypothetical protein
MRDILLEATRKHAEGNLAKHKANVEVYLNKSIGIGEHSDIIETMIKEIEQVAKWEEILMAIDNNFPYEDPARQTILNENK